MRGIRAQVWGIVLGASAVGGLGYLVWPPALVILTAVGYFVATSTAAKLNVPENRLAGRLGEVFHVASIYLVTGSLRLTIAAALFAASFGLPSQLPRTKKLLNPLIAIGPFALGVLGILATANAFAGGAQLLYLVPSALTCAFMCFVIVLPTMKAGAETRRTLRVPQAGEPAPDFDLPTRDGGQRMSLSGRRGSFVLLCFLRGDWCPFCQVLMRVFRREAPKLKQKGVELVVVTPEGGPEAVEFAKTIGLDYTVLFDETGDVGKAYGTFQARSASNGSQPDPAFAFAPVSFLIGPDGVIRFASEPDSVTFLGDPGGFERLLQSS